MDTQDDDTHGLIAALRERTGVIVGVVGLVAWCAMVWFMFGDVL